MRVYLCACELRAFLYSLGYIVSFETSYVVKDKVEVKSSNPVLKRITSTPTTTTIPYTLDVMLTMVRARVQHKYRMSQERTLQNFAFFFGHILAGHFGSLGQLQPCYGSPTPPNLGTYLENSSYKEKVAISRASANFFVTRQITTAYRCS
jgi:hypothetical protein